MTTVRQWYSLTIKTQADGDQLAELYVYDVIGKSFWDDNTVTAKKFVDELNAIPAGVTAIKVRINSPGGDPFEATTIANALAAQIAEQKRSVHVVIEGLAASAATIICCVGQVREIYDNAIFMIHNPWTIALGDAEDMRAQADALDTIRDSIIASYQRVSGKSKAELQQAMDDELWMDAKETKAWGFATAVVTPPKAAATTRAFNARAVEALHIKIPAHYAQAVRVEPAAGTPPPIGAKKGPVTMSKFKGIPDEYEALVDALLINAKQPLEVELATAKNSVTVIQGEVAELKAQGVALTNTVSSLTVSLEGAQAETAELKTKLEGFEAAAATTEQLAARDKAWGELKAAYPALSDADRPSREKLIEKYAAKVEPLSIEEMRDLTRTAGRVSVVHVGGTGDGGRQNGGGAKDPEAVRRSFPSADPLALAKKGVNIYQKR